MYIFYVIIKFAVNYGVIFRGGIDAFHDAMCEDTGGGGCVKVGDSVPPPVPKPFLGVLDAGVTQTLTQEQRNRSLRISC